MYFGVSWLDPRLQIDGSATEWTEVKTGPKDVSNKMYLLLVHLQKPKMQSTECRSVT